MLSQYVAAALSQEITVDRNYRHTKKTYLRHVIDEAMKAAVKRAVERIMGEETSLIEDEVRKAFRRDAAVLAKGLVDNLAERSRTAYGVTVELKLPTSER